MRTWSPKGSQHLEKLGLYRGRDAAGLGSDSEIKNKTLENHDKKTFKNECYNITPKRDTRRIHGGEVGGAPFNTSNTKPTVNIPTVNIPTVNIPTVNVPTVNIPTIKTQKQHVENTNNRQTKTYPWHAIRASAVADIIYIYMYISMQTNIH